MLPIAFDQVRYLGGVDARSIEPDERTPSLEELNDRFHEIGTDGTDDLLRDSSFVFG